jgi:RNA polymerase sigma-70 factor (ECF subfamily)
MEIAVTSTQAPATLVAQAASGDEVALAHLIAEHHAPMVRAAYVIVGDAELAREATQVAWTIAWRRLDTLRDPTKLRPWLVAICANEARRLVRQSQRQEVAEIAYGPTGQHDQGPADSIDVVDLRRALGRLNPDERGLLAMRYVVDLDSQDIAAQLGITASGVRSRLSRLVERLRKDLDCA